MKKSSLLLMFALMCVAGTTNAQKRCATDEMHAEYKKLDPNIAIFEKQFQEDVARFLSKSKEGTFASKTTAGSHADTDYYDIPVVVHVMHNYGTELLSDDAIYKLIKSMNEFYNKQNADLSDVIPPFKPYIGNAKIRFHLATIDPQGNRTKGITHRFTYLTFGGDDQAKMDQWPPTSYYNIWFENKIGRGISNGTVLAYAVFPTDASSNPFPDGVIAGSEFIGFERTIEHETGHYFSLLHVWNSGTGVGEVCGDDQVDDTPPTKGHFSTCPMYDSTCASNYYQMYTNISGGDSLVNYPDTTNVQNVMDYSSCVNMLTKGQVWRMRAALNSDAGGRNNLWSDANLAATGALAGLPDLPPVTDYITKSSNAITFFTFPGVPLTFSDRSWQDTVVADTWTFSNSASSPTVARTTATTVANTFPNSFTDPGWVSITLAATGNNSSTTTTTYSKGVFVADAAGVEGSTYYQEFDPAGDRDKWPLFNYYNNEFKWDYANVGYDDGNCLMYKGYDDRISFIGTGIPPTGMPKGDYDDFFTRPVNLAEFNDACNLNYFYSGASRSSNSLDISDTLLIDYSVNKSQTWNKLAVLCRGQLFNKGALSYSYVPTSPSDWAPMTIALPAAARKDYVVFRFRYKPGVGFNSEKSSGNNFYIDRFGFSRHAAEVANVKTGKLDVAIVPNPTQGDATVVVKDANNTIAQVVVSDITGKAVYTTSQQVSGNEATIVIPHAAIAVPGMYLVQTVTGNQTNTQKLVVY